MALAIFDLDNTLLAGDSDHAWGEFLVQRGVLDLAYQQQNERYYQDYLAGVLDIRAYLEFCLTPLSRYDRTTLDAWHAEFMQEKISAMRLPKAEALLAQHRAQGDYLLIITATNRFVTAPIAQALGVDDLIATNPEEAPDGRLTGRLDGIPSFREGKVERLQAWLAANPHPLDSAWFYSDSHNDLPLLQQVGRPVAVDPDPQLQARAQAAGWPVLSLR